MSRKRTKKFVTIDRDLYDAALKVKLGGRAKSVLFAFLAQTNGFEKNFDKVSWKRYTNITGIGKTHLSNYKSELIKKGYMHEKDGILYLQKDISQWERLPNPVTLKKVTKSGNSSYQILLPEVTESGKHILTPHLNDHLKQEVVSQQGKKEREPSKARDAFFELLRNPKGLKK